MQISCRQKNKIYIMNKIGFQNFRRFQNFLPLEYRGITFLVGRNNAGKSTLVKALLLLNDYLKSNNLTHFSFGNKILEDANIVTFGRAKNRKAKEDYIKFYYEIEKYIIEILISGDDDKTFATVHSLLISDTSKNFDFLFEPQSTQITISKTRNTTSISSNSNSENIQFLNSEIIRLKEKLEKTELKKSSKEYIDIVEELNLIEKKRNLVAHSTEPISSDSFYSVTTAYDQYWDFNHIIEFTISEAKFLHDQEFVEIQKGKKSSEQFKNYRGLKEDALIIEKSFQEFYKIITSSAIIYLGANPAKQSALFPIRDRNNALAQSIHDYYQLRIAPGEKANGFVEKWMKIFEVGDTFNIKIHAGEAYEVQIDSNETKIHLADKGMGSIQAMLLILRLATIIHKREKSDSSITIIIEEPELNLHPALQSKLADLFLEVYEEYKLNFIIETHSEYILRRSQVIVAVNEFEVEPNENPFCVYYFPKDIHEQPYRLEYQEDGSFNKNFGDGFFDEASSNTLELLKLKRQKKA